MACRGVGVFKRYAFRVEIWEYRQVYARVKAGQSRSCLPQEGIERVREWQQVHGQHNLVGGCMAGWLNHSNLV